MSGILEALKSGDPIGELEKIKATMSSDKFKSEMQTALKSLNGQNNNRRNPISTSSGAGVTGSIAGALNSSISAFSSEQISQFSSDEIVRVGNLLEVVQKGGLSIKSLFGMIGVAGDQILNQVKRESQLRTDINENIGIAGDLSKSLRDDIVDSTAAGIRFGYGMTNVKEMIKKIMEESVVLI
jgi:hypothetical protein